MLRNKVYIALASDAFFDEIPFLRAIPSSYEELSFEQLIILDSLSTTIERLDINFNYSNTEQDFVLQVFTKKEEEMEFLMNSVVELLKNLNFKGFNSSITNIYELPGEVFGGYNVRAINFTISLV